MDLSSIKVIFTDVDGVLTDGNLLISNRGEYLKSFNTRDGLAMVRAAEQGYTVVWLTGRDDYASKVRAEELGCIYMPTKGQDKGELISEFLEKRGLEKENCLFIGDDVFDLPAREHVKYFFSPSDGHSRVKAESDFILKTRGGHGVFRELFDMMIDEK